MRLMALTPLAMACSTLRSIITPAKSARGYSCPMSTYNVLSCGPWACTSLMLFHRMMMMIDLVINNLPIVKVIRSRYHWHKVGLSVKIPRNIEESDDQLRRKAATLLRSCSLCQRFYMISDSSKARR